jgi:Icc-related predicted phosphoesterase
MRNATYFALLSLALSPLGCTPAKAPEKAKEPAQNAPKAKPVAQPKKQDSGKPECTGIVDGPIQTTTLPSGVTLSGNGYHVKAAPIEGATAGAIKVGVLSDIKESLPATIANIRFFASWFNEAKIDLLVVNGDVAYTGEDIEKVLRELGQAVHVPILVISGNKEIATQFDQALTHIATELPHLINGNRVRALTIHGVNFVTLPGYGKRNYTEPGACLFNQTDIDNTAALIKKIGGTTVLVAHAAPLQAGKDGIDFMVEGKNVGDARIAKLLTDTDTKFAIVGNIKEAGGRAADRAGKAIAVDTDASELILNPGPTEASPWSMMDGSISHGMAALLTLNQGKARYATKKQAAPTPAK